MTSSQRRLFVIAGTLGLIVLAASLGVFWALRADPISASSAQADEHARVAGVVMDRSIDPVPARSAAYAVVGSVGDTTIEALAADGTSWQGVVVLRISVAIPRQGFGGVDETIRCYRYRFHHADINDNEPTRLSSCPPGPALALTAPPAHPDLSSAGAARLRASLLALPAQQRRQVSSVRVAVTRAFGPPAIVGVAAGVDGTISIGVHDQNACLLAQVSRSAVTAIATHGADCRGG